MFLETQNIEGESDPNIRKKACSTIRFILGQAIGYVIVAVVVIILLAYQHYHLKKDLINNQIDQNEFHKELVKMHANQIVLWNQAHEEAIRQSNQNITDKISNLDGRVQNLTSKLNEISQKMTDSLNMNSEKLQSTFRNNSYANHSCSILLYTFIFVYYLIRFQLN